jgi:thiol-disulfide isomerase/thioredoxin
VVRRRLVGMMVAVALSGAVAGCSGHASNTAAIEIYPVGHRQLVGDVSGTTLQGAPLTLDSYRGKVVVVDFWSNLCGPCHGEEAALESLSTTDASKGVAFVGVDERDNRSGALAFERQYGVTYPSLYDRTDAFVLDFPGAAPSSTPTTIVIDASGRIVARASGAIDYTHLRSLITLARLDTSA